MRLIITTILVNIFGSALFAMHPLVTDDTGTQGLGKVEVETSFEGEYNDLTRVTRSSGISLSYGIQEGIDFVANLPYQMSNNNSGEDSSQGITEFTLELKWLIYSGEVFNFALKPGVSMPAGEREDDQDSDITGGALYAIASIPLQAITLHINLGYIRSHFNDANFEERVDLYQGSVALEWEVFENFKLVFDAGVERNPSPGSNAHPAFILGGLAYSISSNYDIDAGFKYGLAGPQSDYSVMAGLTFKL